jgi:hypothetical protein
MSELTAEEWEAIGEASWHGGANAWRAEVERILAARLADANARLEAVEALHKPDSTGDWCDHCWTGPDAHGNGPSPEWPCATYAALHPDPSEAP